jgi:2-beta-glucuronyltransferase
MKFLFLSTHAFLPTTRKTSVHFVSQALADGGHDVQTISVGYSHLTYFKKKDLYWQLLAQNRTPAAATTPRYRSACYLPLLHPFSLRRNMLDAIIAPFFMLYGRVLPSFMKESIRQADVVVIESGTAIVFFEAVRRISAKAQTLYFARDRLDSVGASKYLQRLEQQIAPRFDRIVVPSSKMANSFPTIRRVAIVPQGIDKNCFDATIASPYPDGSFNAVVVGNMLFDRNAVGEMAAAAPEIDFHLFGAGIPEDFPRNVRVYGERSFSEIVPYIKFANFASHPIG